MSDARCDQLRVVSVERVVQHRETVGLGTMWAVDQALRLILDL